MTHTLFTADRIQSLQDEANPEDEFPSIFISYLSPTSIKIGIGKHLEEFIEQLAESIGLKHQSTKDRGGWSKSLIANVDADFTTLIPTLKNEIKKFQAEIAQRRADGWVRFSRESQSKDDGKSGQVVWYDNKQYVLVADAEKSRRLTDCATNDDGVCVWFWSGWAKPAENAVA